MRRTLLAICLFAAAPAHADSPAHLTYAAYAAGLNVLRLATDVRVDPADYSVAISGRTAGVIGALYHAAWTSVTHGVWRGDAPQPQHFESAGTWGGNPRRVALDYDGHTPIIRTLDPPDDGYHEPVPPDLAHDSIDTLSAMAMLVRRIETTGGCDGAARVFDGRRLSEITVRSAGLQTLPATGRSVWQGEALRCDFEGRQLAGFARDLSPREARRPQHGAAWFARLTPDGPPVPVRVTFANRWVGDATLYLTGQFAGPTLPSPAQIP